jgi:hypothetical protein
MGSWLRAALSEGAKPQIIIPTAFVSNRHPKMAQKTVKRRRAASSGHNQASGSSVSLGPTELLRVRLRELFWARNISGIIKSLPPPWIAML